MTTVSYAWAPITKSEKQDDGTVIVYGPAASSALDRDQQRLDATWLDQAMPRWMAEGGNVREQHDAKRAVGVGVGLSKGDDGAHYIAAHIVDPVAVRKVEAGVLRGFSVGIKSPVVEMGKADAPNGLVTGGDVIEVSVVDRPANPECTFELAKADAAGDLAAVEGAQVVEKTDAPAPADDAVSAIADMPHIRTKAELRSIIRKAEDVESANRLHISSRAKALGLTAMLPARWTADPQPTDPALVEKAEQALRDVRGLLPALAKADDDGDTGGEAADIQGAQDALAIIARLIIHEAESLAAGQWSEAYDIATLLDAVRALRWFQNSEECEDMALADKPDMAKADTPAAEQPTETPAAEQPADAEADAQPAEQPTDTPAADEQPAPEATAEPAAETPADDDAPMTRAEAEAAIAAAVEAALAELAPEITDTETTPAPEPETVTKAELAEMVKSAVAEAKAAKASAEAAQAANKALEADLAKATSTLAEMQSLPMPGGPALTRTAAEQAAATKSDADRLRAEAEDLLRKADQMPAHSTLANGYRQRARDLLTKAAA